MIPINNDSEDKKESTELSKEKETDKLKEAEPTKEEKKIEDMSKEEMIALLKEKDNMIDELKDKYLRVQAELENFKKRMKREMVESVKYSNEQLIKEILPIIDNFERALSHSSEEKNLKSLVEGIEMTLKELFSVLKKYGLKEISSLGKPFDPSLHEAVMVEEKAEAEPNTVLEEFQKGYILNDRLLRPAKVVVSKVMEQESSN